VSLAEFVEVLTGKLCWRDGETTCLSHGHQRQCRFCRKKWCYEGLTKRWRLAEAFCAGLNRRSAAQVAGVSEHTAGHYYRLFQDALDAHLCTEQRATVSASAKLNAGQSGGRIEWLERAEYGQKLETLFRLVFLPVAEHLRQDQGKFSTQARVGLRKSL